MMRKRKWSVVDEIKRQYAGVPGKLQWTTNLSEALEIARVIPGGKVVDTEWFRVNFNEWKETGVIPEDMQPGIQLTDL